MESKLPKDIVSFFYKLENKKLIESESLLKNHQNNLKHTQEQAKYYENEVEKCTKLVADLRKKETKENDRSSDLLHKLRKHIAFDSIKSGVQGGYDYIDITTKLLFSNIREKEGSRNENRACLGAYKIRITPRNPGAAHAKNLTFQGRDHWATSATGVCLGDWIDDYYNSVTREDFYTSFEAVIHLLTDASLDAAAYMRSHEWRDRREFEPINDFKKGDKVIFVDEKYDNLVLLGHVGMVHSRHTESSRYDVIFREAGGASEYAWTTRGRSLVSISDDTYNAQKIYEIPDKKTDLIRAEFMGEIDRLPNGSTNEDATEIVKKFSERIRSGVDLIEVVKTLGI